MPTIHIPTWLKQLSGQLGLTLIKPTRLKQVGSNLTCDFAAIDEAKAMWLHESGLVIIIQQSFPTSVRRGWLSPLVKNVHSGFSSNHQGTQSYPLYRFCFLLEVLTTCIKQLINGAPKLLVTSNNAHYFVYRDSEETVINNVFICMKVLPQKQVGEKERQ